MEDEPEVAPEGRRLLVRRFGEVCREFEEQWRQEQGEPMRSDWFVECLLTKTAQVVIDSANNKEHRRNIAQVMVAFFVDRLGL